MHVQHLQHQVQSILVPELAQYMAHRLHLPCSTGGWSRVWATCTMDPGLVQAPWDACCTKSSPCIVSRVSPRARMCCTWVGPASTQHQGPSQGACCMRYPARPALCTGYDMVQSGLWHVLRLSCAVCRICGTESRKSMPHEVCNVSPKTHGLDPACMFDTLVLSVMCMPQQELFESRC